MKPKWTPYFKSGTYQRDSPNENQALDAPLTLSEIKETISSMNSGKSPGPDGYPVEFYKRFSNQLAPLLLEVFNHSYSQGSLPATLQQASISLIHKKDKDPLNCASYRPISLLPVDVKILKNFSSLFGAYYAFNHFGGPDGVHCWEALLLKYQKASRRHSYSILSYRSRGGCVTWRREGLWQGGMALTLLFLAAIWF